MYMCIGLVYVYHNVTAVTITSELRRMNMRSEVGRKDVFLSYAHIDINFARKIKVLQLSLLVSMVICVHSM